MNLIMFKYDTIHVEYCDLLTLEIQCLLFGQAYGKAGRYDEAEQLFRTLQDPDPVAVSSMLALQDTVGNEVVPSSQELDDPVVLNQLLIRRAESGGSFYSP